MMGFKNDDDNNDMGLKNDDDNNDMGLKNDDDNNDMGLHLHVTYKMGLKPEFLQTICQSNLDAVLPLM